MTLILRLENQTSKPRKLKSSSICCQSDPKIEQQKLKQIFKNEYQFKRTKEHYKEELNRVGFKHTLVYNAKKK